MSRHLPLDSITAALRRIMLRLGGAEMKPLLAMSLLLLVQGMTLAQQSAESASPKPALIQGSGCVSKAVESSCLVLKDAKTGETYNLLFADHSPPPSPARYRDSVQSHRAPGHDDLYARQSCKRNRMETPERHEVSGCASGCSSLMINCAA
jgi:hypothetical protein